MVSAHAQTTFITTCFFVCNLVDNCGVMRTFSPCVFGGAEHHHPHTVKHRSVSVKRCESDGSSPSWLLMRVSSSRSLMLVGIHSSVGMLYDSRTVPNVRDGAITAARTAADERTCTRAHGRRPGQPATMPDCLVPAEQARVGQGGKNPASARKQALEPRHGISSCSRLRLARH